MIRKLPLEQLPIEPAVAQTLWGALKLDGFFPEFTVEHARKLFLRSGFYLYPRGAHVVDEGERGRDLYVMHRGQVEVVRKAGSSAKRVAVLREGDLFGDICMRHGWTRSATVVALEDSKIFRLVYEDIRYLMTYNKELGSHLDRLISQRFGPA